MTEPRTKIGNSEVKVTPGILEVLRRRVFEFKPKHRINRAKRPTNYTSMAKELAPMFPTLGEALVELYAAVVGEVSDYIFGLYMEGKFTTGVLTELGQADMSPGYKDKLALKVVELNLTRSQIRQIKSIKKKRGDNVSIAELIQLATGEVDAGDRPEAPKQVADKFGETVERVLENGSMYSSSIEMAIDTIPGSVLAGGVNFLKIYDQIVNLTVELERTLPFLKQKKKEILLQIKNHVMTELKAQPEPEEIRDVEDVRVRPADDIGGT